VRGAGAINPFSGPFSKACNFLDFQYFCIIFWHKAHLMMLYQINYPKTPIAKVEKMSRRATGSRIGAAGSLFAVPVSVWGRTKHEICNIFY